MNHVERRIARTNSDRDFINENLSISTQFEAIRVLLALNDADAVGAACAYLLEVAQTQPQMIRRVLNERIIKQGFTGISLLDALNRVAR